MSVTIREMLNNKYFKDFKIIAGFNGTDRRIHAATVFDSPDGYKSFKGNEFVLSTGYLFIDNVDLFKEVVQYLHEHNVGGLGIKIDRYLKTLPDEIYELANDINFPIIDIPYDAPWVNIINHINSVAVNRFITSVIENTILEDIPLKPHNLKKKIDKILICLFNDIRLPISVLNLIDKSIFTYPHLFTPNKKCINYNASEEYTFDYRKETIYEKPNIVRYADLSNKNNESWLVLPVTIKGLTISKVIVWENDREIDFQGVFSLKIGIALLYVVYEHIYSMNSIEGRYYNNFLSDLINNKLDTMQKVRNSTRAFLNFSLELDDTYIGICIKQEEKNQSLYTECEKMYNTVLYKLPNTECIYGLIDDNTILILYNTAKLKNIDYELKGYLNNILNELRITLPNRGFKIGIGNVVEVLTNINKSYTEALKAIAIGTYIYPNESIISFNDLGPFGILNFEDIEKNQGAFEILSPLLNRVDSKELVDTLRAFLDCNLNYNKTAQKLFVHSNTVRYRISKIQELGGIDLEDPIERLKLEIVLRFLNEY